MTHSTPTKATRTAAKRWAEPVAGALKAYGEALQFDADTLKIADDLGSLREQFLLDDSECGRAAQRRRR